MMENEETALQKITTNSTKKPMVYKDILQKVFNYLVKHTFNASGLFEEKEKKSKDDNHFYKATFVDLPAVTFEFFIEPTDGTKTRYTFGYKTYSPKRTLEKYSHTYDLFEYEDLQAKMLFLDENEVFNNFMHYNKEISAALDKKKTMRNLDKWAKEMNEKFGNGSRN